MTDLETAIADVRAGHVRRWGGIDTKPEAIATILNAILSGEMMLTELHKAQTAALIEEVGGEVAQWSLAASEDIDALTPPDAAAALDRAVRRAREEERERFRVIKDAYEELLATVRGECPSLVNEDSGASQVMINLMLGAEDAIAALAALPAAAEPEAGA